MSDGKVRFSARVEEALRNLDSDPAYIATRLKFEVGSDVLAILRAKGKSPAWLAKRLGKSRQYVTKMLKGNTNFTLESLAALSIALGAKFEFTFTAPAVSSDLWRALEGGQAANASLTLTTRQGYPEDTFGCAAGHLVQDSAAMYSIGKAAV